MNDTFSLELYKELCARLPYGVICWFQKNDYANDCGDFAKVGEDKLEAVSIHNFETRIGYDSICLCSDIVKPYLRPLSSMTEDEEFELNKNMTELCYDPKSGYIKNADPYSDSIYASVDEMNYFMNFMYSHHFDINDLIGKGLALTAPDGMYDTKGELSSHKYFPSEFGSYEEYAEYLKGNGYALDAPEKNV